MCITKTMNQGKENKAAVQDMKNDKVHLGYSSCTIACKLWDDVRDIIIMIKKDKGPGNWSQAGPQNPGTQKRWNPRTNTITIPVRFLLGVLFNVTKYHNKGETVLSYKNVILTKS